MLDQKYSIPIQINVEAYTEESNHKIAILMDSTELISKTFKENTIESINFNQNYDFGKPGFYNLVVNWNGDKECREKYFKIKLCKINNELINTNSIDIEPIENEYIKELKSDPNKIDDYYDKLIRPGERHGWYGSFKINFCIGTKKDIKLLLRYSKSTFLVNSFKNKIYV
jgi:hypothetical protein